MNQQLFALHQYCRRGNFSKFISSFCEEMSILKYVQCWLIVIPYFILWLSSFLAVMLWVSHKICFILYYINWQWKYAFFHIIEQNTIFKRGFFFSHGGLTTYVAVAKCYKIPTIKCRLRSATIHINVLLWHLYRHFIFLSIDKKWWCIFRDLTKSNSILLNVLNMSHSMMVVIHKHHNQFLYFCHANVLPKVFYEWQGYR